MLENDGSTNVREWLFNGYLILENDGSTNVREWLFNVRE